MADLASFLPRRSGAVRAVNRVGRWLGAAGLAPFRLEADALLERAARSTGLGDFGDPAFREPLEILCGDYRDNARLSLVGRLIAQRDLLRILENRLQLVDARKRHPELADEQIRAPLFIVGLPRTGSSVLHELLALDPETRTPMSWEVMWPSPFPEAAHRDDDPRIAKADRALAATEKLIPGFRAMHRMGARLPQECVMLLGHEFVSMQLHCSNRVPDYQAWFEGHDCRAAYASHRRQLQHLQLRSPGARWALKSPQHLWCMDALLSEYPDAHVVQTHRDPVKVAASLASLVALLRSMSSDEIDPLEIGADWTARLADGLEHAMEVRGRAGADESRFHDLHFRDFMADPLAAIEKLYAHVGWPFSEAARARMSAYLEAHPADEHGGHVYSLEGAGLDLGIERERFSAYVKRYAVESEA